MFLYSDVSPSGRNLSFGTLLNTVKTEVQSITSS